MPDGASSESDNTAQPQSMELQRPKHHLLYIDARRLSRDYVSRQLAMHLSECSIESAASAGELSRPGRRSYVAAIVHAHTTRVDEPATSTLIVWLAQFLPGVPIMLMSDADTPRDVIAAFHLGVRGYIPTSLPMRDAAEAIRFVCEGGTFIPPSALAQPAALPKTSDGVPCDVDGARAPAAFTSRQWDVLRRLWQGKPNKVIARELEMSEGTVKVHLRHMMKKLHARNRTEVVMLTHPSRQQGSHRIT
jgi:DNA-binding NarL/FixJ family response regulator